MTTRANVEACPEGMEDKREKRKSRPENFVIKNRYILNYDPKMCFEKEVYDFLDARKNHSKGEEDSYYSPSLRVFFPSPPGFGEFNSRPY